MLKTSPPGRAFTLVELLVVITIIMLLLSMLTPGLEKAFQTAQRAKCAANLHAIHLGTYQYATNNQGDLIVCRGRTVQTCIDGAFPNYPSTPPKYHDGTDAQDAKVDWLAGLASVGLAESAKTTYSDANGTTMQNRPVQVWQCPTALAPSFWNSEFGQYELTYCYMGGIGRRQWVHSKTGQKYDDPPSPDKIGTSRGSWMLAGDLTFYRNDTNKWKTHLNHPAPGGKGPVGSNQVFLDGAAQWIERDKLFAGHTFWANVYISFFYQSELPEGWTVTDADRPDAFN
jgi:type II secretory pathway pseudopilin PulG